MTELTSRDRAVLEFERQWWRQAGAKEQAIRDAFDLSSTRYYQVLNDLLDRPEAVAHDPILVRRLQPAPGATPAAGGLMASVEQLSSGKVRGIYRDASGRRHSASFPNKTQAREWGREQERMVRLGRHRDPKVGRLPLADYEPTWWAARVAEPSTLATDRGRIARHVLPESALARSSPSPPPRCSRG